MNSPVIAVRPVEPVAHAKNMMLRYKVNRLVVMERGTPVGMLSMWDIAKNLESDSPEWRRRPIDQIPISRIMHKGVVSVNPNTALNKVAELMLKNDISSILVKDDEKPAGIVTKTDLVKYFAESLRGNFKVAALMTPSPKTVNRGHSLARVLEVMRTERIARVVVTEGEKPVGIVTESDIGLAQLELPRTGKPREVRYTRKLERGGRPRARYVKQVALLTADDIMTQDLTTVGMEDDVAEAAGLMLEHGISGLPVVHEKKLVGILTKTDLVKGISRLGLE
jgi:CBS domain-containing protein